MPILRRVARPMLAAIFVSGGIDALRNPASRAGVAGGVAPAVAEKIPGLADLSTEQLVQVNAAVQVTAGSLLALNRLPRLSATALAASLVPTTLAGHRFWEQSDAQRKQQQVQFLKNVGLFGGLLLAAADTEGRPGLAWRARHRVEHAEAALARTRRRAERAAARVSD